MLHIDAGYFIPVTSHSYRIYKRICSRPVGKSHKPLLLIPPAFIFNHAVPCLTQHGLKSRGLWRCKKITAQILIPVLAFLVGIDHQAAFPFYSNNIAEYPGRDILSVTASPCIFSQRQILFPMNNIHNTLTIFLQSPEQFLVVGVTVGIKNIVVNPNSMNQVKRFCPVLVILIKSIIKILLKNGINSDGVCPQLLDLFKPPQIHLLVNRIVCGPFAWNSHTHIDSSDFKGDITTFLFHQNCLALHLHKRGNRLVWSQIYINSQTVIRYVPDKQRQHNSTNDENKFFHSAASFFPWP